MAALLIDDFNTAMTRTTLGVHTEQTRYQSVNPQMARMIRFAVTDDPHNQQGSVEVRNGLLIVSAGYDSMDGLTLQYGGGIDQQNGQLALKPLHLDFTKFKNLLISFNGSTQNLNINVVIFSNSGRTSWSDNTESVVCKTEGNRNPKQLVVPTASFVDNLATHTSYKASDIHVIHIGIQNLGFIGGHDYAITKIELL
ncbi:hypothetical protein [Spirosoma validum]|uniref:Uncharacterized protein n=1 Tax=Spirosoma validum TaxID=2771355 RepID=A0A927B4Z9_9BACT|nr:hypothetical protein [Spirosoma validum]MBD2755371.1 hypothetical protein [Spirosoma validum]